jgi:uncharacterized protein
MPDDVATYLLLGLSALVAGAINSIAGGGTLFTFSALLTVVNPVVANATSTVALVPGSVAGAWAYRREMRTAGRWTALLIWPSLLGGAVGSLLVTELDESYFRALVPWLLLTAAVLFMVQPVVARLAGLGKQHEAPAAGTVAGVVVFQFFVAVYGGYFGAGIGILMLSALGLMGFADIHCMNALKTLLAACINGVSVVIFVAEQKVEWRYALSMAVAAIVGGYVGARVARRLDDNLVRWVVILIGLGLAAHFFYKQWRPSAGSASKETVSADLYQIDFENQLRVGGDSIAGPASAIAQRGRYRELSFAPRFHAGHALVPAFDDFAGPELKSKRLLPIMTAVEFLAIRQPARVVDLDGVA